MSPIATAGVVFAIVSGSSFCGMLLQAAIPREHLSDGSKDTLKLATGLIGTLLALVLGLLIASSKSFYETQSAEITQASGQVIILDRLLAMYGPETKDVRSLLRATVVRAFDRIWSQDTPEMLPEDAEVTSSKNLYSILHQLSPQNDQQRSIKAQALVLLAELLQTRWLMYEQSVNEVPSALLVVLVFWLSIVFLSFGLLAPRNATVVVSLFLCALCASTAVLMVLEMYDPYRGLMRISSAPLRSALAQLGH